MGCICGCIKSTHPPFAHRFINMVYDLSKRLTHFVAPKQYNFNCHKGLKMHLNNWNVRLDNLCLVHRTTIFFLAFD